MKNLMLFVSPNHEFLPEHKIAIKIQIDNSLDLGWKVEDIILATNFPYEYNGVGSVLVSDDNYCDFFHSFTLVNVIVELFDRKIIKKGELYWYHDEDAYELYKIKEAELDLGDADMAMCYKGIKEKWDAGSIFFKSTAEDIFRLMKEVGYKFKANEEDVIWALDTNNILWLTNIEADARAYNIPLFTPERNIKGRIKTLNLRYMFGADCTNCYDVAEKPLKVAHFHFSNDIYLDSMMFGKNILKKRLLTKRLIKIFHKHGIKGTNPKKMKNLMIYLNPEKKFLGDFESLVKKQIDNSLELGWKKEDIILITNFPYEYQGIKATLLDDSLFEGTCEKANKSNVIFHLLAEGVVKEAELWWYHDLDVFQLRKIKSPEIDLQDTTAGFIEDNSGKLDTDSFFFRKDSNKIFEWMRNKTCRGKVDETTAFASLVAENFRNINSRYVKLSLINNFTRRVNEDN